MADLVVPQLGALLDAAHEGTLEDLFRRFAAPDAALDEGEEAPVLDDQRLDPRCGFALLHAG